MKFYSHARARRIAPLFVSVVFVLGIVGMAPPARSQQFGNFDRARGKTMLDVIRKDIVKNYYDPNFHGVDIDARFKAAEEKIQNANSNGEIFGIIAQTLIDFHDSHLFFVPPERSTRFEYGWKMTMIGDKCFVTAVRPGSDAEAKGLKCGDMIANIDGYQPTKDNIWLLKYLYYSLRPRTAMQIVAVNPAGEARKIEVAAKVTQGKLVLNLTDASGTDLNQLIRDAQSEAQDKRHEYYKLGEVMIWKMPQFDLEKGQVDKLVGEAKDMKGLVIDMRGNGGGSEEMMLRLIGDLVDHKVEVGTLKRRKETKPLVADTRGGDKVFGGKLVLLIDSASGSASELFSRVMQLEKRATVVGDQSAGAVMESKAHGYQYGTTTLVFYGASITDADIVMSDGKSLENVGVTPDEILLPTAADLAADRDPVLSRAVELAGGTLDPEKAGAMFPVKWRTN